MRTMPSANLDHVVAFVSVVQHGSFSAAARALGVPKSSVSRRISQLELQLETKLLQRTTRKHSLTSAGEHYFATCQNALAEIAGAEHDLEHLREQPRGLLKVTAPANFGFGYFNRMLREYLESYPEVQVMVDLSDRYVDLVAEGFDVAIRAGTLRDSSMVARRVAQDAAVLVASPSYLQARGTPVTPEDLRDHDCLLFRATRATTTWRLVGANGPVAVTVRGRVVSTDLRFLESAAVGGDGIALLPQLTAREHLRDGSLVRVLPDVSAGSGTVSIVYPSAAHLTPKTQAFVELAVRRLRDVM